MEGMKSQFLYLGVRRNEMIMREHSFILFSSKSQIFIPLKLGGMRGNKLIFNENFVKSPKIPLQSQPFSHIMTPFFFPTSHN